MAVAPDEGVVGSLSGGCVEGAVHEVALEVIASGTPRLESYGVTDDDAYAVGLPCGGTIDVFVEPLSSSAFAEIPMLWAAVRDGEPTVLATVVAGAGAGAHAIVRDGATTGSLGEPALDRAVAADAETLLSTGGTAEHRYPTQSERAGEEAVVLLQAFTPAPAMYLFGAIEVAAALARIGTSLGYRVTVCDARETFATAERFPHADEVVVEWPHRFLQQAPVDGRTVICVLTHDPKFDVPVLQVALRSPAAYIGVMGSRRTHADRVRRLLDRGVTEPDLSRIAAPIGLDLGARTPAEMAVAIAAELIARSRRGSGRSLADTTGAIHQPRPAADAETTADVR
jgi:xanthine dehydrogenase accessory factor